MPNSKNSRPQSRSNNKLGYTEAQIRARAVDDSGVWWTVKCLNEGAHKNRDEHPSAYYNSETHWYACRVCELNGFADDRDRPNWNAEQVRTYSNGKQVHRNGRKIWQKGSGSRVLPLPYGSVAIHDDVRTIYVVEGEKCVDELTPHLDPRTEAVVSSIGGSNSAHKTDWSPVRNALAQKCNVVFLPDLDEPGERYIQTVGKLLRLSELNVLRLGGDGCPDGYDVADWLQEAGNDWSKRPDPVIESMANSTGTEAQGWFGYTETTELQWLSTDMIPANKLTIVVGRAGIGKSTLGLYIASRLSQGLEPFTGKPMLSHSLFDEQPRVMIYSEEDDWSDTMAVRLQMMGANMDHVGALRSQTDRKNNFKWDLTREEFAIDYQMVLAGLQRHNVKLLVVDPLLDIITGGNNNDPAVIREAIETKINPILETGCTVLGIHHERKDARREDLLVDRAIGSQAWTAVARSVLHMQGLPKRKALGTRKNPAPRSSLDGRFNIKQKDLGTNSNLLGVVVVSKSNLAKVDGGYHYELPTRVPTELGQTSSFIQLEVNPDKITERTPEELVQIYNPLAPEKVSESAVNRKARLDMGKEAGAVKRAEASVREIFEKHGVMEIATKTLTEEVLSDALVGERNAKEAINRLTESKRDGNNFFRVLKKTEKSDEEDPF